MKISEREKGWLVFAGLLVFGIFAVVMEIMVIRPYFRMIPPFEWF